jgi:hypothetical protein
MPSAGGHSALSAHPPSFNTCAVARGEERRITRPRLPLPGAEDRHFYSGLVRSQVNALAVVTVGARPCEAGVRDGDGPPCIAELRRMRQGRTDHRLGQDWR